MITKIKEKVKSAGNWIKRKAKEILITLGIIGIASAAGIAQIEAPVNLAELKPELAQVENWKANKPNTDKEWLEDVKKESFNVKYDYQLDQMEQNLTEKLPKVQKDLDKFLTCLDCIKYELRQRFEQMFKDAGNPNKIEGKTLQEWIDGDFNDQLAYYTWKTEKIKQSVERINKEKELRTTKKIDRSSEIIGTTYYIDAINGTNTAAGTATATAWRALDQFTENARSAGDIVKIRRNTSNNGSLATTTTSVADYTATGTYTDLGFTSDGTIVAPIVIEADYDNSWADFGNSSGTATLTFGSTTITMSTTSPIMAGDWIYNPSDNNREYAYEVATATATTLELYLPFKGTTGAGITLTIMPDNPQWGQAAGNFQWNFDTDNYWKVQGIDIRGTDMNGQVEIDSSYGHQFIDSIFINNSGDMGINRTDDYFYYIVKKSRFYDTYLTGGNIVDVYGIEKFYDIYYAPAGGIEYVFQNSIGNFGFYITELYDVNITGGDYGLIDRGLAYWRVRNLINSATSKFEGTTNLLSYRNFEDNENIKGTNLQYIGGISTAANITILSTSTTVRSGGGATSLELRPTTNFGTQWDFSKVQLFEYPIYADTTSKTYSMYFRPASTTAFTTTPTASELWIECEYWGHASNNYRRLTKSTATIDTSTTTWQAISVICQPSQNGILYLRSFYAKTLETGKVNILFMDVSPIIE